MSKIVNDESQERPEHLEQIRDIIFGPQKREFETRLRQLEEKFEDMKSSLTYAIDELTRSMIQEIRSSAQTLDNKLKASNEQSEQERESAQRHITQMESRFDKSIQQTIQTAAEKITSVDLTMKAESTKLRQELLQLQDQLLHALDARASELTDSKVSRDTMAEALIELGMKVKAGERISELKLISQKKPNQ